MTEDACQRLYNGGMADDDRKGVGDALTSLGSALTSPAKLAFAGFVLLVYKGALCGVSLREVVWIAVVFILAQVLHDDFFRIVLNRGAHRYAEKRGWPSQDGTKSK
jgi:hypothetical protein